VTIPHMTRLGTASKQQIVAQGVATKYELDMKRDKLLPELKVEHKINVTFSNSDSESHTELGNVATSMIGEQKTRGLGTAECMVQGLASEVGTQELIPRVGLVITNATGIINSVATNNETMNDENGVGIGNLPDMALAMCETEDMIESVDISGADDKPEPSVMPDQTPKKMGLAQLTWTKV
jgi:hypothetical protein